MDDDGPAPAQPGRPGAPASPRQAASVILVRGGRETLEVLLVRRNPAARFMGGVWVFPGGAVDPHEAAGQDAHRLAAVRELEEEAGIRLPGPACLTAFSRWITPAHYSTRFDTRFFVAPAPAGARARADGRECVDVGWFEPSAALASGRHGAIELVLPTMRQLEQLAPFGSADALLDWAPGRRLVPVGRSDVDSGEAARLVLPGDPGQEWPPDAPSTGDRAARRW